MELPKEPLENTIQLAPHLNTKRLRPLPTPFKNNGTIFELEEDKVSFELNVHLKFPNGEMMLVSSDGREITMVSKDQIIKEYSYEELKQTGKKLHIKNFSIRIPSNKRRK